MVDAQPKEGVKSENSYHINLIVSGQDGLVVQMKITRPTPTGKLMKAYCEGQDIPAQLEMEEEDTIFW
ncbi:small ubiquitin-related modifier 2-A-like [Gracilinanus agilis]|uniref:small ubiquitin-related modifier 2-A-like n=1 Tax=Gracilinanus agilis TaxID=191870 RepID=UPI001CFD4FD9|nr:small ubiquitin-related modifier 2-A-like [Gracilinanus agilis]